MTAPDAVIILNLWRPPYDSLWIRFVYSMAGGSVLNANGTTDVKEAHSEAARWCPFHGTCARNCPGGAVLSSRPSSPRYPTPYVVCSDKRMSYISVTPTFTEQKLAIPAGGSVRFRYAVSTFPGQPDRAQVSALYQEWTRSEGRWA